MLVDSSKSPLVSLVMSLAITTVDLVLSTVPHFDSLHVYFTKSINVQHHGRNSSPLKVWLITFPEFR